MTNLSKLNETNSAKPNSAYLSEQEYRALLSQRMKQYREYSSKREKFANIRMTEGGQQ